MAEIDKRNREENEKRIAQKNQERMDSEARKTTYQAVAIILIVIIFILILSFFAYFHSKEIAPQKRKIESMSPDEREQYLARKNTKGEEALRKEVTCPRCGKTFKGIPSEDVMECPICYHEFSFMSPVPVKSLAVEVLPSVSSATKTCSFCGETILSVAIKCKHCGEFLDQRRGPDKSSGNQNKVQTIEMTGKKWKSQILLSVLLFVFSIFLMLTVPPVGALLFLISIVWYFIARFGSWWDHG